MSDRLLLIGSIPHDTVEEVFRVWGGALGPHLPAIPDGEVGDRINWIDGLAYRVFNGHPELETIKRPAPDDVGVERWIPRNPADQWKFRVRDGVEHVRFGDPGWRLGYAKEAIASYFVFRTLKRDGVLPESLRFQVCLPLTNSALFPFFSEPADHPKIIPGYEDALRAEIEMMVENIPHGELAIQFDAAVEMGDMEGRWAHLGDADPLERGTATIPTLVAGIPDEVMVGYHLCFGTLGGWPLTQPDDMGTTVAYANAAVAAAPRRIDFVHIPVLDRSDDEFLAPLERLDIGDARPYLGLIHNMQRFEERYAAVRRHLADFGLAGYCGFGREPRSELPQRLQDHLDALEIADRALTSP